LKQNLQFELLSKVSGRFEATVDMNVDKSGIFALATRFVFYIKTKKHFVKPFHFLVICLRLHQDILLKA